jgi:DnaK suppressor protein
MTTEELGILKSQIKKELLELEKSVMTLSELLEGDGLEDNNGWYSTEESNPSKEINEYSIEKAKKRIITLNEVLGRMDKPDFGICVSCGKSIPFGRMKAVPTSKKCMACN